MEWRSAASLRSPLGRTDCRPNEVRSSLIRQVIESANWPWLSPFACTAVFGQLLADAVPEAIEPQTPTMAREVRPH